MWPYGKPSGDRSNSSATAPLTSTPENGTMPLVTPFANVMMSGVASGQWQAANHSPVRPNAVIVSSNTSRTSWRSQMRRSSAM